MNDSLKHHIKTYPNTPLTVYSSNGYAIGGYVPNEAVEDKVSLTLEDIKVVTSRKLVAYLPVSWEIWCEGIREYDVVGYKILVDISTGKDYYSELIQYVIDYIYPQLSTEYKEESSLEFLNNIDNPEYTYGIKIFEENGEDLSGFITPYLELDS